MDIELVRQQLEEQAKQEQKADGVKDEEARAAMRAAAQEELTGYQRQMMDKIDAKLEELAKKNDAVYREENK